LREERLAECPTSYGARMEVRRLSRGEGALIRKLRLGALRDAPYAFAASFEQEAAEPPEDWDRLAARSESADDTVVFVAVDDGHWVGMVGGYLDARDPRAAGLWGMWVAPISRRRGLGAQLVEAVIAWARDAGASRVELSVTDRANVAAALYRRLGFRPTGERRPLASDAALTEIFLTRSL
jgi:GNAT superfamily N-acetyltransferase